MIDIELRKRFNPEGSMLRLQQKRMLEMLIELDRICKKHNIKYWLSGGTLIGAMRHNGFIPWDDDLDVEIMRDDYLKLIDVLPQELPDWLSLQNDKTDENYFFFYSKLRDKNSHLQELTGYDRCWKEQGIYIDIFPMEKHNVWIHKITELSVGHMYKIWRTSKDDKKSIKRVKHIFNFSNQILYPLLRSLCKFHKTDIVMWGMGIPFHTKRYEYEIFPLTTHIFEGLQFPVPHDADNHLRHVYGDYMQLPDLEQLKPHVKELTIDNR